MVEVGLPVKVTDIGRMHRDDNAAARALDKAFQRKVNTEKILRQYNRKPTQSITDKLPRTPEKVLVNEVLPLLEMASTLDLLNPGMISPDTFDTFAEALERLGASVSKARAALAAVNLIKGQG